MRRGDRNAVRLACAMVFVIPAAAYFSTSAKADPVDYYAAQNAGRVCAVLDAYPSFDGIGGIADSIVNNTNLSYRDAGEVIATSVYTVCPQHLGLIKDFAATYASPATFTSSASIGGVVR